MLQLLWCPRDHPEAGYAPLAKAWWRSPAEMKAGLATIRPEVGEAAEAYVPLPCRLFPERVAEYPSADEFEFLQLEYLDELIRTHAARDLRRLGIPADDPLYQYHFSVAPGTKVGGYVRWIQSPDVPRCKCRRQMEHLLTIASAEFDGSFERWMPLADRYVWSRGYKTRNALQRPAGLMLGDMGDYYVFVCRTCPGFPIRTVTQCS